MQARAVQALCGVFVGCPRLMLITQNSGLLGRILDGEGEGAKDDGDRSGTGGEFSAAVHERLLLSLQDMMKTEEVSWPHPSYCYCR